MISDATHAVIGPHVSPEDLARLHYGRLLWKRPGFRRRLLGHWRDARHPYAERFEKKFRGAVERVLAADPDQDAELDRELCRQGLSLRVVMREIPPVIGSFF